MLKELALVLCVAAAAWAVPAPLHPNLAYVLVSTLNHVCGEAGLVTLSVTTANIASTVITVGPIATPPTECRSAVLEFPGTTDETRSFATTAANTCSRVTGATGAIPTFTWTIHVEETIPNGAAFRVFRSTVEVTCAVNAGDLLPVTSDNEVRTVEVPAVSEDLAIAFTLVKEPELDSQGHWVINLAPTVAGSLGVLDFKIASCSVEPNVEDPSGVSHPVIAGGCISDDSASVNVETSPVIQVISLYPVQFAGEFLGVDVRLVCDVELCTPTGDDKCGALAVCPAEPLIKPVNKKQSSLVLRSRRSVRPMFTAVVSL